MVRFFMHYSMLLTVWNDKSRRVVWQWWWSWKHFFFALRWILQLVLAVVSPPQSLHWLRMHWCAKKADPPQSKLGILTIGINERADLADARNAGYNQRLGEGEWR